MSNRLQKIRLCLRLATIAVVMLFVANCKPRHGSSLASDASAGEQMLAELANVYKIKGEVRAHASQLNATPVLEEAVTGLYRIATESRYPRSRYYAASSLGELVGSIGFEAKLGGHETLDHKQVFLRALQSFRVKNPVETQCTSGTGGGASRELTYCVDYETCVLALGHFVNFAKGYPATGTPDAKERFKRGYQPTPTEIDRQIDTTFNQIRQGLEGDARCIMLESTQESLSYKINVGRILHGFLRSTRIGALDRIGVTPSGYAGETGAALEQMGQLQDRIGDMARHLDALIKHGREKFFHQNDPSAASAEQIRSFVRGLTEKPYEDLKDEERRAVTELLDSFINSNEGTYRLARKLRFLIERLNHQDPTRWLSCVEERVRSWYRHASAGEGAVYVELGQVDTIDDPKCPAFALSAEEGFEVLTWYGPFEMKLPFRRVWVNTLKKIVQLMPQSKTNEVITSNEGEELGSIYELSAYGLEHLQKQTDTELAQMLQQAHLPNGQPYPVDLVKKDELIAKYLKHYHSLFYNLHNTLLAQIENTKKMAEARYIMGEEMDLQTMQQAYTQRGIEEDASKLYSNPDEKIKQTRETFSDEEKQRALELAKHLHGNRQSHDLSYACLDYRFGAPGPRRIETKGNQGFRPSFGCWESLYFGTTRGFVENLVAASDAISPYDTPNFAVEEYVEWAEYFMSSVGQESWNQERYNPFHDYGFKPSQGGRYDLEELCKLKDEFGENSYKYLRNRVNHWLYAQSIYEDCEEFTLVVAINLITLITLPATGFGTNLIIGAIVKTAAKSAVKRAMIQAGFRWSAQAILSSPKALGYLMWQVLLVAKSWAIHSLVGGAIFTTIDHLVMSAIGLRELKDPHLLQHYMMGVGVMGIIGIANPMIGRLSARAVSPLLRRGWQSTAEYSAAGLTFSGEVYFFANLHNVTHFVTESGRYAMGLPPTVDETWREKYKVNPYLHAFALTAAFKVGHSPLKQARAELAEVREWQVFYEKDIQLHKMLGSNPADHYLALELPKGTRSTPEEIKAAMERASTKYADVPGSVAQAKLERALTAFEALNNPVQRKAYDQVYEKLRSGNSSASAERLGTGGTGSPGKAAANHYERLGIDRKALERMSEKEIDNYILSNYVVRRETLRAQLEKEPSTRIRKELEQQLNELVDSMTVLRDPYQRNDYNIDLDTIGVSSQGAADANAIYDHRI